MKNVMFVLIIAVAFCIKAIGDSYVELVPNFKRYSSHVMIRKIKVPVLANLDFAAYDKNPVLFEPLQGKLSKVPSGVSLQTINFSGAVSECFDRIENVPLSEDEKRNPIAWKPFIKKLWNVVKDDHLQKIGSNVNGYKWDDSSIYQPYQEISAAYLTKKNSQVQIWVKIEFNPWVNFINIDDEDMDGSREMYGKLNTDSISPEVMSKIYTWVTTDYQKRIITNEEMVDWITDLASYWYPAKNTDILDLGPRGIWPDKKTSKKILKELGSISVDNPLAVVEGKPFSPEDRFYNVYIVSKATDNKITSETTAVPINVEKPVMKETISENFVKNMRRFDDEISKYGTYQQWKNQNDTFLNALKKIAGSLPVEQMGIEGKDGWLFFRKSIDYLNSGDLSQQAPEKNPVTNLVEFNKFCKSKNITLLFVPIPSKEEVYPEMLPIAGGLLKNSYVNPFGRKFMKDLQDSGIEVIDILPQYLQFKANDTALLYQKQDTHWTNSGLEIIAAYIADRIKKYSWYETISKKEYNFSDTTFERLGDIVDKLPQTISVNYHPKTLKARQVKDSDGKLYKGNASAPIMLIGDSFTGVFESVDCKSAGVGAHIAALTAIPVDIITSWGGGPMVRQKAIKAREKNLDCKRLIIYMMTDRDLFNYSQNWDPFPEIK